MDEIIIVPNVRSLSQSTVCGYTGIIGDKCPKCGRSEAEHSKVIHERIPRAKACCEGDN